METTLTFDILPVVAALSSILVWIFPGLKEWYAKLEPDKKQLSMIGLLLLVSAGAVLLSALEFIQVYHGPTWKEWIWYPVVDFVIALLTNAGVYKATNRIFEASARTQAEKQNSHAYDFE